jgi:hypothetical protein
MTAKPQPKITRHELPGDLRSQLTFWENAKQAVLDEMASYGLDNTDLRDDGNHSLEAIQEEIEALGLRIATLEIKPTEPHHWLELQRLLREASTTTL